MSQQTLFYLLPDPPAAPAPPQVAPGGWPGPLGLAAHGGSRMAVLNAFGWVVGPAPAPRAGIPTNDG